MGKLIKSSALLLVILLTTSQLFSQENSQPQKRSMSLEECIDFGLQNNEVLKVKNLEKDISKAKVDEIRSIGLPQASVSFGGQKNFKLQRSLLPASFFDPNALPSDPDIELAFVQDYVGDLSFKVNQLLFDGSYFVGLKAATTYRQLANKDYIASKVDVVEAINKAYLTVLINESRIELVDRNLLRLNQALSDIKQLLDNGFAESTDVDKLQVTYNNLMVEQSKLKKLVSLSYDLLKFQMGMSLSEPVGLSQKLEDFQLESNPVNALNYDNRVEYSKLLTNEELVRLDLKNNRVKYLPRIFASFAYGSNTQGTSFSQFTDTNRWLGYGNFGLGLTIPVFDGLLNSSKIQQNKIQLNQLSWSKSMLEKSIDIEVRNKQINVASSLESIDVQRQNVSLAKRVYERTEIKYKEGLSSNLELIDADASLKESETNYYNALYEALVSKIELEKALGILLK